MEKEAWPGSLEGRGGGWWHLDCPLLSHTGVVTPLQPAWLQPSMSSTCFQLHLGGGGICWHQHGTPCFTKARALSPWGERMAEL